MLEVIVFPDAEQLLSDWLTDLLDIPFGTKPPDPGSPLPTRFGRVLRLGGSVQTKVTDGALVMFEDWAELESQASADARLVRGHVSALAGERLDGHMVCAVEESAGPQNYPDPTLPTHSRYTQTHVIHIRGQAL